MKILNDLNSSKIRPIFSILFILAFHLSANAAAAGMAMPKDSDEFANQKPWVTKIDQTGPHVEIKRTQICRAYETGLTVTRIIEMPGFQPVTTYAVYKQTLSNNIGDLIERAKKDPVETMPGYECEGATTAITARDPEDANKSVTLYASATCQSAYEARLGFASQNLRDLVTLQCPGASSMGN